MTSKITLDCVNKNKIFYIGVNPATGKKKTKITSIMIDYILEDKNGKLICCNDTRTLTASDYIKYKVHRDYDLIPCGTCIACRLKKSMEYAARGVLESDYHDTAYFLTLTYDESNVPKKSYTDAIGRSQEVLTLKQKDIVLFKKRLRRSQDKEIVILDCGEYGSKTMRPHYHMICWDLEIDDLQSLHEYSQRVDMLRKKDINAKYFKSDIISQIWGKGFVTIAPANFNTIAYVCRYTLKKQKNDLDWFYDLTGAEREFRHFPKRPALGKAYFDEHYKEIYERDEIIHEGFKYKTVRPPKYFDFLLDKVDPVLYNKVKQRRRDNMSNDEYKNLESFDWKQIDLYGKSVEDVNASISYNLKRDDV